MIVLGIDPGEKCSGWALAADPEAVVMAGTATSAKGRRTVLMDVLRAAAEENHRIHVVMEAAPTFGGSMSTAIGMGIARGRWFEQLEGHGIKRDKVRIVTPDDWRRQTHGVVRAKSKGRKAREAEYKGAACAYTGIDDPDAAEAACIAMVGAMMVEESAA